MSVVENAAEQAPEVSTSRKPRSNVREVAVRQPTAPASINPVSIVERAIEKGITGADLKEIMDLQERWEASQARKAFDVAMANAQADMPLLVKNRLVNYESQKSPTGYVTYRHEDLAEIVEKIRPVLHQHGLAHRFRTEQMESGQIKVTCIITGHGHREETSLVSTRDTSGGKNNLQEIASTVTYLERYTLKAALGLAAAHDDDSHGSEGGATTITALQLKELEDLAKDVGANIEAFCKYCKTPSLAELPSAKFERAKQALEAKRSPL